MKTARPIYGIGVTLLMLIIAFISRSESLGASRGGLNKFCLSVSDPEQNPSGNKSVSFENVVASIQKMNLRKDFRGLQHLADSMILLLPGYERDSLDLAEFYYYIGVCKSLTNDFEGILWHERTIELKKKLNLTDVHYANSIFNIGVMYNYYGDFQRVIRYMQEYVSIATDLYGGNSTEVAQAYSTLIGASIESQDYRKFPDYTFTALGILGKNRNAVSGTDLSNLYHNIGIGYLHTGDYAKARIFLEEAEVLMKKNQSLNNENYINLINTLAIAYGNLGLKDKESEYFNKGLELAVSNDSFFAFNMINTYVTGLDNPKDIMKGEKLLSELVGKSRTLFGSGSKYYIEALRNYAQFLLKFKHEYAASVKLFEECIGYIKSHREDVNLKVEVLASYAEALFKNGAPAKALGTINTLLFNRELNDTTGDFYSNPPVDSLKSDRKTMKILSLKYDILWSRYSAAGNIADLKAAAALSELMISLIDRIRMNISEEESRLLLGDRYRVSYLIAIRDFELCYRKTGDRFFLEKTFEFAERSKVAGLLASTRELNAIEFRIPANVADQEKSLQREISFYNSVITSENEKALPDKNLLADWKSRLLSAIKVRDSLVTTFERDYPGYYSVKYMNNVPALNEIPSIIGRNNNYLNYVVSDSMLYIFLVNRKHKEIITCRIDTVFFSELHKFRTLLADTDPSLNAGEKFSDFRRISRNMYLTLIEPVSKFLISANLIISPDNVLSYIPFETITCSEYDGKEILYRKLDYLMNRYNISYNYSATYMEELVKRKYGKLNRLIAFAPIYTKPIDVDSLFMKRDTGRGVLYDLPFARQEAEFVAGITGGDAWLNKVAKESVFKSSAGRYKIIHLAMHTILNDQNPMNSAMIFAQGVDKPEDGLLYTYEVYGIPLRAGMVVLSSCNTGTGMLASGEGILSLARGFLYSGSRSVVMSMWEVDDKSGTDIIKMFYKYLKKGKSKSEALKRSRADYLRTASQIKSHPYYWSTLVIYGDNSPLYPSVWKIAAALCTALVIAMLVIYYFRKRRYS